MGNGPDEVTVVVAGAERTLVDPRYVLKNSEPSKEVSGRFGAPASYYSFNHCFGRQAGVAVVGGAGFIGEFIIKHLPADEVTLIGTTLSRDAVKAATQQKELGLRDDQVIKNFEDILNNKNVDVVIIATDNASHYDFAKRALEKGKHVICEKPVAVSAGQARELHELADKLGLSFTLNHFYAQYTQVANLGGIVQAAEDKRTLKIDPSFFNPELGLGESPLELKLGKLKNVSATYDQDWVLQLLRDLRSKVTDGQPVPAHLGKWRLQAEKQGPSCAGGDIGVHDLEILGAILGSLPKKVLEKNLVHKAEGHEFPLDVEASADVEFENGIVAEIRASQIRQGTSNDIEVILEFDGGTLTWSNRRANVIILQSYDIAGGKPIELERGRPPLRDFSSNGMLLEAVVEGHDQGHGHCQTRLIKMALDGIVRKQMEQQGKSGQIKGKAGYSPGGKLGIAEMEIVEQLAA